MRARWYTFVNDLKADLDLPGIYEWRIPDVGLYVVQASKLRSRLADYENNILRMLEGMPYHGDPKRDYRPIHYELLRAHNQGVSVIAAVLENCHARVCHQRKQYWIARRKQEELVGGPRLLNQFESPTVPTRV